MLHVKIASVLWRCRAFVTRHRGTALIAIVALALSASQWRVELMSAVDWAWPKLALQSAIIVLTMLFAVIPTTSSVLIIVAYSIDVLLPYSYMESNGWCLDIALGYIVYAARPAIGVGAFGYLMMMRLIETAKVSGGIALNMLVPLISGYIVAALIGLLARRQRELALLHQRELRMRQVERNLDTAHRLHDATSGELTSIGLMARLGAQEAESAEQRELFTGILTRSNEALAHVHDVIRILSSEDSAGTSVDSPSQSDVPGVRSLVDRVDQELHDAGFVGTSTLHVAGSTDAVSDRDSLDVITEILREVCTNIIRHCDPENRQYTLDVDVSKRGVDIHETNAAVVREASSENGRIPAGHGLALLRHRLAACGGTVAMSCRDGVWRLHVHVPVPERIQTPGSDPMLPVQ